ncbi:peptidase S8 [Shewanella sp. GutCb]|uniref:S8 family serine peptidase n=1 Tax=Shewanella sp. GutCb TaxID=2058315 RepID=UPI000C7CE565|nr:S8 family serine peptidase [Shewanella sp. GutCb]PKG76787.1 peptidase S8 [Shewanella sp. GutCb]
MKLKKISMVTIAAIYAAGAGAVAADSAVKSSAQEKHDFIKEVSITPQMVADSEARKVRADRFNPGNTQQATISQANTHRAAAQKVPFKWEADVEGIQTYIIEFNDSPVATYNGGISGLSATNVRGLSKVPSSLVASHSYKIDVNSQEVKSYVHYLEQKQAQHISNVTAIVGSSAKVNRTFKFALNGATMKMTQQQASRVAKLAGIKNIQRSINYKLNTDVGPKHIKADEIWIPNTQSLANKGEGVVVGILDTGINSDHPSFAAVSGDGYTHNNARGQFYGDCEKVEFASMCNDKLIGVRSYPVITDSYSDPAFQNLGYSEKVDPKRPENGEDYQGHGSHTASTVAGNELFDVPYQFPQYGETNDGFDTELTFAHMSGVAPRANIISYQVCYPGDGSYGAGTFYGTEQYQGCPAEALVSAVEDAIIDQVDVINFSIGGGESNPWESVLEMAFLSAREAGIVVAASAGNSSYAFIDHVAPWITSVAATTHGRTVEFSEKRLESLSGGDTTAPSDLIGAGYTEGFSGSIVLAANYGDENCNSPFTADTFTIDQIVVCKRGDISRLEKAINVQAGGAGGFVLYNADYTQDAPNGYAEPNDPYVIPGVLIQSWPGQQLTSWLSSGTDHMASINASSMSTAIGEADFVADFSSRGPSLTTPDSMAPKIGAPGVDIYAAFADDQPFTTSPFTSDYTMMSGTSMAGPHIAGSMALLKQLNPEWTPAEIESALMMTANNTGTITGQWGDIVAAGFNDFGSGVVNVKAASMATLVMDETADNYRAANPHNGGDVSSLNTPYLFGTACSLNCSFVRTFRATEDGAWNVEMEEHTAEGLALLQLSANPSSFTLKKGQVQTVQFSANVSDIGNVYGGIQDVELEGHVTITPQDTMKPAQTLPMRIGFNSDGLPNDLSMNMHRTKSVALTPELFTKQVGAVKVSGLVKGEQQVHNLVPYSLGIGTPDDIDNDPGIAQINFIIPEGTKRFVFEVTNIEGNTTAHDTAIDIGFDANGDGRAQWSDEAICYSFSYARDFCAVENPTPGDYWALVGNYTLYDPNYPMGKDQPLGITSSLAIIPNEMNGELSAEIVGEANGADPYRVNLAWDVPTAEEGDVYYAAVELGRNDENPTDVGMMGLRLETKGSDLTFEASQDAAKAGDIIDFYMEADPNMMETDRNFSLKAVLPEGLTLVKSSVEVAGIYADMATIDGNNLTIEGVQPTSAYTPREYVWTTNETDPLCRQPYADADFQENFIDLGQIMLPTVIEGGAWDSLRLDIWQLGFDKVNHYGQDRDGQMQISPGGYIAFDQMPYMNWGHMPMENLAFPDTMVAPLWHSEGRINPGFDMLTGAYSGVYVARTDKELLVQWNNMTVNDWWTGANGSYTFQTIYAVEPDFTPGKNEIIFAYKRLDESLKGKGSIGTRGYHGFRNPWAPNEGWLADTFAFDNVLDKVSEFSMVCGNYQGPEQTAVKVKFSAVVNNNAAGNNMDLVISSDYDNAVTKTITHNVMVNGNINMGQFNDVTIDENTKLTDLAVVYSTSTNTDKVISVSGDNITAMINGHTSGSMVDVMPDSDWHGSTMVTVTVSDAANSNDMVSSSFMLTVTSNGVEPTPPATETPDEEVEDDSNDSGGSLGFLALALLGLFAGRRKLH